MGSICDDNQNANWKSFFAFRKKELLDQRQHRTKASMAIFEFVESLYNPGCRKLALGYHSPVDCENSVIGTHDPSSP